MVACFVFGAFAPLELRAADESLAALTPADTGLFVELRNSQDLLTPLLDPYLWTTLAELAGQPATPELTADWRKQVESAVKMTPEEAVRTLLSRQVAFAGLGPGRSQDGLLLCRPVVESTVDQLLARWNGRALNDGVQPVAQQLSGAIGVVAQDGAFLFGDLRPPRGMLKRARQRIANNGPSLATNPRYTRLLGRLTEKMDGVLFARLRAGATSKPASAPATSQTSSAPASRNAWRDWPGPLESADNVLVGMRRDGSRLHFTIVSDAPPEDTPRVERDGVRLEQLPETTLFAWRGDVDFSALRSTIDNLPQRNAIRAALSLPDQLGALDRLSESLGRRTGFALGFLPHSHDSELPPTPVAALLVTVKNAELATEEFANVARGWVALLDLLALARGGATSSQIEDIEVAPGITGQRVDLGRLAPPNVIEALGRLEFCWAIDGEALLIASHVEWLREIVAARHSDEKPFLTAANLDDRAIPTDAETVMVLQSGGLGDLASAWLDYLKVKAPQILDEKWWRRMQPSGARLGVNVEQDVAEKRLKVTTVHAGSAAAGVLQVGDYVVGCEGKRFNTTEPIREINDAIQNRAHSGWVSLAIARNGTPRLITLPIAYFYPIETLHRVTAIGRLTETVLYHDDRRDSAGPRGTLTVEMSSAPAKVVAPATASAPASQP